MWWISKFNEQCLKFVFQFFAKVYISETGENQKAASELLKTPKQF